jgi:hypothetical protein
VILTFSWSLHARPSHSSRSHFSDVFFSPNFTCVCAVKIIAADSTPRFGAEEACWAHNPEVVGSKPAIACNSFFLFYLYRNHQSRFSPSFFTYSFSFFFFQNMMNIWTFSAPITFATYSHPTNHKKKCTPGVFQTCNKYHVMGGSVEGSV